MTFPSQHPQPARAQGFTLIEISLVMALIIGLSLAVGLSMSSMHNWEKAKAGSLALQATYAAQRGYMADHPTADIATVTSSQLQAYLPQGWSVLPTVTGENDEALTLDYTVMPPRLKRGTSFYDPSPKTNDGLWDVGE